MKMNKKQCKDCPWKKLAQAREDLLNARMRKAGSEQLRLHELISNLVEQIAKEKE